RLLVQQKEDRGAGISTAHSPAAPAAAPAAAREPGPEGMMGMSMSMHIDILQIYRYMSSPRLAEAVHAPDTLWQQRDEQRLRQTDHVQVVPVDLLDQRRPEALDRVGAGAALPLPAGHVVGEVARVERSEGDARHLLVHLLPGRSDQREAGDDL